ncbi:hypothetical protein [Marivita sp. S0852]|uniref:hypothetical protein n=1 Tax=Marivita sp. S0852 TaxID=3373893 RepID=UPI003981B445
MGNDVYEGPFDVPAIETDASQQPLTADLDQAMIVVAWHYTRQVDVVGEEAREGRISDPLNLFVQPSSKKFCSALAEQPVCEGDLMRQ